jgi:hypothetical protein
LQRKDVDPLDVAKALKKLADMMEGTSRQFAATGCSKNRFKRKNGMELSLPSQFNARSSRDGFRG